MDLGRYILFFVAFSVIYCQSSFAQANFRFPTINDARNGHINSFKIPKLNDYKNFTKGYQKHLAILDRRSEKAYHKSFLKFINLEDKLLYTLCDSNEFRANALMRSAAASYGKMESDRNKKNGSTQSRKETVLASAVEISLCNITELDTGKNKRAGLDHKKKQKQFNSRFYTNYMKKRVGLYKVTFKEGTKRQKKMLRKLRKRALLWQSYKSQDQKLIAGFTDKHMGIMKSLEANPNFASAMNPKSTDFSGTQLDPNMNLANIDQNKLFDMLQRKVSADGLLTSDQLKDVKNVKDLFGKLQKAKEEAKKLKEKAESKLDEAKEAKDSVEGEIEEAKELKDSALSKLKKKDKNEKKEKPLKLDSKSPQRFWDRLYGGADFDWENSTGYYPDGLGVTLNGGYNISDNSGLTLEIQTLFNGSKMGFTEDMRFESTLVSNYTVGANIDYRLWKIFFAGIGSELIINNIDAPAEELILRLQDSKYTYGIPLIFKVLLPISGVSSTNIEFRYDLNSKNNIKPKFDFKVGFLIGR